MTFELFYDFVCPYAYLASLDVEELARQTGSTISYRPILLGGVYRAIGNVDDPNVQMPPARLGYVALDLQRAAAARCVSLRRPTDHPRRTVLALRATLASGDIPRASRALFAAYWRDGLDLEDPGVVARALTDAGFSGEDLVRAAGTDAIKAELRARTEDAVRAGVFGVPSFVVPSADGAELFWGQDRMDQVRAALCRDEIGFFFDYSSPFAYLASTQLDGLAARTGARIRLEPLLLGGLFKALGRPNVPLFEMPKPKQIHVRRDLDRWAARWGVPFRFASRFPMNTVKALRLTLACADEVRPALVSALFRALWVEDRDLADPAVLDDVARSTGAQAALPEMESPEVKQRLFRATERAQERGVFGVPTLEVRGELYWGQDRLEQAEAALRTPRSS